jgi:NADH:ubiquinone oxidoreductase subunit K
MPIFLINKVEIDVAITLITCLNFSGILFIVSMLGVVCNKKNYLLLLISAEMMFFSLSLNFIFSAIANNSIIGFIYAILTISSAAIETVVGLCLLILVYRLGQKVDQKSLIFLKG